MLIHGAVAAHAAARPDAVAIRHDGVSVSYRELETTASGHAAELAEHGVGPGSVVPVSLPRSPALVASLLAVLKCGAAYAALDARWPQARISAVLDLLDPPVVVGAVPGRHPNWSPSEAAPRDARPFPQVTEDAAATLFATSGTTGAPKTVLSPHRATTRLFRDGPLSFGPGWAMPQAAALPWDAASLELWGMLTTGGTVVLTDGGYFLPDRLADLVARAGVNAAWLTSSVFNLFVEEDLGSFAGMRQVMTGGERLSVPHVARFLARHPDIALYNGYGPVESCVFATMRKITSADCELDDGIPLGTPVPGTEILVCDGDTVLPPGETGEIVVAGDGLAIGYYRDPESTAAKFGDVAGRRCYRTGDLGRLDPDGLLHFGGRADRQVKIRGYRVEPAEVEQTALRIPGVRSAAAVPVPGALSGYDRLALFYTADADLPDLRTVLAGRLPLHLVPDVTRRVDVFPLSANGKLDSAALLGQL